MVTVRILAPTTFPFDMPLSGSPAYAILTDLRSILPPDGPMCLGEEALELFERIEDDYDLPVIDLLDALRFETPENVTIAKRAIIGRIAYTLGRTDAERGQVVGAAESGDQGRITDVVRTVCSAMRDASERGDVQSLAFYEGVLDGLASLILERFPDDFRVQLVVVPDPAFYTNDVDLSLRFANAVRPLSQDGVEYILARAKRAFNSAAERLERESSPALLVELAVRRVEIALAREEVDARANDRLHAAFLRARGLGASVTAALHSARNDLAAALRDRIVVLPSYRLLET